MSVTVETLQDSKQRTQLVIDRLAYEQDPDALVESCRPQQVCVYVSHNVCGGGGMRRGQELQKV
jgi:hypothetical protein